MKDFISNIPLQAEEELQIKNFLVNYRSMGYSRQQLLSMTLQEVLKASITLIEKQVALQGNAVQFQLISQIFPATPTISANARFTFPSTQHSALLTKIFQLIEENYQQPITLSNVAKTVGYSPAYLTDLVRRETGKTINRWIIERRLAQACFLLQETDQPIEKIASVVGYQYVNHFFRQFRQYYGITPQAWRNLYPRILS